MLVLRRLRHWLMGSLWLAIRWADLALWIGLAGVAEQAKSAEGKIFVVTSGSSGIAGQLSLASPHMTQRCRSQTCLKVQVYLLLR